MTSEKGLMHQPRRLQRLAGLLLVHLLCSQSPEFFVDQRQKLFGRLRIALLNCGQDSRDVAHTGSEGASEITRSA
jgi:hypothetical protein